MDTLTRSEQRWLESFHRALDDTPRIAPVKPSRTKWEDFVGQEAAVARMQLAVKASLKLGRRIKHTLLSASTGAGKTTLAHITAAQMGADLYVVTTVEDFQEAVKVAKPGSIILVDEAQVLRRGKIAPLLTYMSDEDAPCTVMLATTDAGLMEPALLNRCSVRPQFTRPTNTELVALVQALAARVGLELTDDQAQRVYEAAGSVSRDIQSVLDVMVEQQAVDDDVDVDAATAACGYTPDGMTAQSLRYLSALATELDGPAPLERIRLAMGESGPVADAETRLIARGYVKVGPSGRRITEAGKGRLYQHLTRSAQ